MVRPVVECRKTTPHRCHILMPMCFCNHKLNWLGDGSAFGWVLHHHCPSGARSSMLTGSLDNRPLPSTLLSRIDIDCQQLFSSTSRVNLPSAVTVWWWYDAGVSFLGGVA